jgi:hypothetical protein
LAPHSASAKTAAAKSVGIEIVHHKVADFAKWLAAFKADKANQVAAGLTAPHVYHSADDPNDVVITFKMADIAKAKAFAASDQLKTTMQNAGVVGAPDISYLVPAK